MSGECNKNNKMAKKYGKTQFYTQSALFKSKLKTFAFCPAINTAMSLIRLVKI